MRALVLSGLVVLAVAPAAAEAARPATAEEQAAIFAELPDLDGRGACATTAVSTADPAWAVVRRADTARCGTRRGIDALLRRGDAGGWAVWNESQILVPAAACEPFQVPAAVGADLGVCSPAGPRRFVPCSVKGGRGKVVLRERPAACSDVTGSIAESWMLTRLRWSSWGPDAARGRGLVMPNHLAGPRDPGRPVTVRLSNVHSACGAGRTAFAKISLSGRAWRKRVRGWDGRVHTYRLPAFKMTKWLPSPADCVYGFGGD
jgi:hypothetical protein